MPASTLRAVEIAMRIAASLLRPALCGAEDYVLEREQRMVVGRGLLVENVEEGAAILPDVSATAWLAARCGRAGT